jgi:parvulin-like peptidyl-prolyl isomerase
LDAQQPDAPNSERQQQSAQIQNLAVVNGQAITRQQLANECLRRFGTEVLESIINKHLIISECQARGIEVTEKDVNDEIAARAEKFGMTADHFLKLVESRRNVSIDRYINDIVWNELRLRRLAATELEVTDAEIQKRMEFEFGPKVQVREIVLESQSEVDRVMVMLQENPSEFGRIAKDESINPNSAAVRGLLPPIRKNSGMSQFEQVAFSLQPGQISAPMEIEGRFIILQCERIFPAVELSTEQLAEANERIVDEIRNDKLAKAGTELFDQLQKTVKITNVMNDQELSKQMPGIAALVNDLKISKRYVAEECIARYGHEMLDAEINRTILLQELQKRNQQVSQQEVNDEIARAAESYGYLANDGKADIDRWMKFVTQDDANKIDFYIEDEVWPSVALRKLVEQSVSVTDDDMKKGFEANFGPRVEVLAIVLSDHRMALKVWKMASSNLTKDYFGELSNQYSVEPASKNNFGQVPPIQLHGGKPELEREAFRLNPGELSEVVQVRDHWVILYCLGRTTPVVTEFEAVKDELQKNIFEKKMRLEMRNEFDRLRDSSQIDNFLAGTSQSGRSEASQRQASPTDPTTNK